MRLNVEKKLVVTSLWLALNFSLATSTSHADGFYTIIGPDGHPMIVQKPEPKQKVTSVMQSNSKKSEEKQTATKKEDELSVNKVDQLPTQSSNVLNKLGSAIKQPNQKTIAELGQQNTIQSDQVIDKNAVVQISKEQKVKSNVLPKVQTQLTSESNTFQKIEEENQVKKPSLPTEQIEKIAKSIQSTQNQMTTMKEMERSNVPAKEPTETKEEKHFTEVDGVQYVTNEYLEDREFNLEGKKRFYMTPEVGAGGHGRYETIERQKGLSASLLERIRNKPEPEERKAVVLSTSYFRLPKDEVVKNLEQACFSGKKVIKAKNLSIKNQELGLWPVAPIKEHFAYEVVKLDTPVQNVLLTSYASSSKVPTYYWPLVVFLDQKGCVIEGVSGFKNEESTDNNTQYAAMEGILRKPENAAYMFLTPLSSAVDVENKQLTNHGQIKLSVIQ